MNLKWSSDWAAFASSTIVGVTNLEVVPLSEDRSVGAILSKCVGDCQKSEESCQ